MGTFTPVTLYDRGSGRPVSGRTARVTTWPAGAPLVTDPELVTTDMYGSTPEFTVDGADVVIVSAGSARPRTLVSVEKRASAEPELPQTADADDVLTWDGDEWVARPAPVGVMLVDNGDGTATIVASSITNNNDGSATLTV